jgi:2'-5' RNA ligase
MGREAEQGAFVGFGAPAQPIEGLFFAVLPDAGAAERITALARDLREAHALRGKVLELTRLHVSLHYLGGYEGLPQGVAAAAIEAAAAVVMPSFDVLFDRAASFRGRAGNHPYVLQGGDGVVGLLALHGLLGTALQRVGLGRWVRRQCLPHITMLYDHDTIANHPVEPIGWTVREVVLVRSLYGDSHGRQGRHEYLARRVLGG